MRLNLQQPVVGHFAPSSPAAPTGAVQDEFQPTGAADSYREMARARLQGTEATATLVELTALQLVEQQFLQHDAPPVPTSPAARQGMLRSATYLNAVAAAQLGVPPALAPTFMQVLNDLDPAKIMPTRRENGANAWLMAGDSLQAQIVSSRVVAGESSLLGVPLTGLSDADELGRLRQALEPLAQRVGPERLTRLVKHLHVQTLLGEMQLPGQSLTMGGLGGLGALGISRESLFNPARLSHNLAHEIGHLVDEELGYLSLRPGGPFGKGNGPADFRSEYARLNPGEDFAETHADLLLNWETYKKYPRLAMLARGAYGEKLACIAREAYGWEIPEPEPTFTKMFEDVKAGQSPFGFYDGQGRLSGAEEAYQRALTALLNHTGSDGNLSQDYLDQAPAAEREGRIWLAAAVHGQAQPGRPSSVRGLVTDLTRLGGLSADDPERAEREERLQNRLERGGAAFFSSSLNYIQENFSAAEAEALILGLQPFLARAARCWLPGVDSR